MENKNHYIIIMAGGIGSRFWPMSRTQFPKQFHDILGRGRTLIQETFERFESFIPTENIYIVTNERYKSLVQAQLPKLQEDQILLEPVGRNTAPCVAYACYKINKINPDAVFAVAPADHIIHDEPDFQSDIELGLKACKENDIIMTLGITPSRPDTGFGYIQFLEDRGDAGYYKVKTFTEKPNLEVAKSFVASGDFLWNAGIFLFSAHTILNAFQSYLPEVAEIFINLHQVYYTGEEQGQINEAYATCKSISMDYGIMEKADNVFTIPSSFGWSDLGTWGSVHENSSKDQDDNALPTHHMTYNSQHNVIRVANKDKLVVVKGLEGFIVVDTEDALLICPKEEDQFIKTIVGDVKNGLGEPYV